MNGIDGLSETLEKFKEAKSQALKLAGSKLDGVLEIFTALEMEHAVAAQGYSEHDEWTIKNMIDCLKKFCATVEQSQIPP